MAKEKAAIGYKGHRAGTLVEKAHKIYDQKGREKMIEQMQDELALSTCRTLAFRFATGYKGRPEEGGSKKPKAKAKAKPAKAAKKSRRTEAEAEAAA